MGKTDGKRPLGRPRRRWEDGIKIDFTKIGCVGDGGGVDSPGSGYGPAAGCCENGDEPSGSGATELVNRELHIQKSGFVRVNPLKHSGNHVYHVL
jgi:hypothetical protein